mmetsp:Transcript_37632/g.112328  ORF Transcript_37632/g.112328 Transcript_37632/m.112328 type:complete len:394 (+) Transcript_37632:79-1260(+)
MLRPLGGAASSDPPAPRLLRPLHTGDSPTALPKPLLATPLPLLRGVSQEDHRPPSAPKEPSLPLHLPAVGSQAPDLPAIEQQQALERIRQYSRQKKRLQQEEEQRREREEAERQERLQQDAARLEAHRRSLARRAASQQRKEREEKESAQHELQAQRASRRERALSYATPGQIRERLQQETGCRPGQAGVEAPPEVAAPLLHPNQLEPSGARGSSGHGRGRGAHSSGSRLRGSRPGTAENRWQDAPAPAGAAASSSTGGAPAAEREVQQICTHLQELLAERKELQDRLETLEETQAPGPPATVEPAELLKLQRSLCQRLFEASRTAEARWAAPTADIQHTSQGICQHLFAAVTAAEGPASESGSLLEQSVRGCISEAVPGRPAEPAAATTAVS